MNVPMIPYDDWIQRVSDVAESNTAQENVTALALVDFFRAGNFGETVELFADRAIAVSPALAGMKPLGAEDAHLYLEYWRKLGHVSF